MLVLPQTVKMKWHGMNKEWFISKRYTFTKISDEFEVSVLDLMEGSDKLVKIICDNCETLFERKYYQYLKSISYNRKIYCSHCTKLLQGYTYDDVKNIFESANCVLLSDKYTN